MYNFDKVLESNLLFLNEPFTKREAFLWLVNNSTDDHIFITTNMLSLKWNWHVSKVKRFLSRLQEELLIKKTIKSGKLFIEIMDSQNNLQHTSKKYQIDQNQTNNRLTTSIANTGASEICELDANQECINKGYLLSKQTKNRLNANIENSALSANSGPETDQDLRDCKKQEKKKRTKKRKEKNTKEKYIPYRDIQKEKKFSKNIQANTDVSISDYQTLAAQRGIKKSQTQNQIFQINLEDIAIWAKETLPFELDLGWELGKFQDYWNSIPKKPPKDGRAAFRNWLRKAVEIKIKNGGNNDRFNDKNAKQRQQGSDFERFLTGGARALAELGGD